MLSFALLLTCSAASTLARLAGTMTWKAFMARRELCHAQDVLSQHTVVLGFFAMISPASNHCLPLPDQEASSVARRTQCARVVEHTCVDSMVGLIVRVASLRQNDGKL